MTAGYKNWADTLINGRSIYRVECQTWWHSSCKLRELFTDSVFSGAYKIYIYCLWGLSTLSWLQGIARKKPKRNHESDGRQIWESSCCLFFFCLPLLLLLQSRLVYQGMWQKKKEEKLWGAAAASPSDLMVHRGRGGDERRMKDEGHAMPLRTKLPNVI